MSGKLSEDRPLIKQEIAEILKAEAELAAKLLAIEEEQYRKKQEEIVANNIEETVTEKIKAFKEEYEKETAAVQV